MTLYTVTGTVPTPMADKHMPQFGHHPSTWPTGKSAQVGEAGRKVSVTTDSKAVAKTLQNVFTTVFDDVKVATE